MDKLFVTVLLLLQVGFYATFEDDWDDEWELGNFRDTNFLQNQQHMEEHHGDMNFMFGEGNAKEEEMEFHFFKAHDLNSDDKLDGLEIMAALKHGAQRHVERAVASHLTAAERKTRVERVLDRLSRQVDEILKDDDKNDDGYISYVEYASARRTADVLHEVEAKENS